MWQHTPLIPALGSRDRQISVSSRTAWSTELFQDKDMYRESVSKNQKLKVKIKVIDVEIKPHKDGKHTENLDTVCYYALFELFEC